MLNAHSDELHLFLSLWKRNYLPQPHAENAACLNEPLVWLK